MWEQRLIVESVYVGFVGNKVDLDSRVGDGWGEAGGKLMEEFYRQVFVCRDGDDGDHSYDIGDWHQTIII